MENRQWILEAKADSIVVVANVVVQDFKNLSRVPIQVMNISTDYITIDRITSSVINSFTVSSTTSSATMSILSSFIIISFHCTTLLKFP